MQIFLKRCRGRWRKKRSFGTCGHGLTRPITMLWVSQHVKNWCFGMVADQSCNPKVSELVMRLKNELFLQIAPLEPFISYVRPFEQPCCWKLNKLAVSSGCLSPTLGFKLAFFWSIFLHLEAQSGGSKNQIYCQEVTDTKKNTLKYLLFSFAATFFHEQSSTLKVICQFWSWHTMHSDFLSLFGSEK